MLDDIAVVLDAGDDAHRQAEILHAKGQDVLDLLGG